MVVVGKGGKGYKGAAASPKGASKTKGWKGNAPTAKGGNWWKAVPTKKAKTARYYGQSKKNKWQARSAKAEMAEQERYLEERDTARDDGEDDYTMEHDDTKQEQQYSDVGAVVDKLA